MPTDYVLDKADQRRARHKASRPEAAHVRMPSTFGYMASACAASLGLFFLLWWILLGEGDESPWLPSGLAAGVVLIVAIAGREVVMRRAWARYSLELEMRGEGNKPSRRVNQPLNIHDAASSLRALQRRLKDVISAGPLPDAHLEASRLCQQFIAKTEEAVRAGIVAAEARVALRAGQEHVRSLQKQHTLTWARSSSQQLAREAQLKTRMSDKIETAASALEVIEEGLSAYPEEKELAQSAEVIRDFVASVKVAHWIEQAERASFRGRYNRAIARYSDALYYLSRSEMSPERRMETGDRIVREIEMLRARIATTEKDQVFTENDGGPE